MWRLFRNCVVVAAVLHLIVLGVRVGSLARHADLVLTSGVEEPCIYAVWKVINGHPLYEWPNQDNYALTLYNFGFYHTYGGLLKILGVNDDAILWHGRLLTLAFTFLGCLGQWCLMRRLTAKAGPANDALLLAAISVLTWFGYLASWYPLTIRPDIASVAIALWGLFAYVAALGCGHAGRFLLASLLFFAAWTFKQSTVWLLAGTALYAVGVRRNWKEAALLILPCGVLMALCLGLGGEQYRYNVLFAPSVNHFIPRQAVAVFARAVVPTGFLWLAGIATFWMIRNGKAVADAFPLLRDHVKLFWLTLGVATVMSIIVCGKHGSTQNQMLEPYILAGTLAGVLVAMLAWVEAKGFIMIATAVFLPLLVLPAAQLAFPEGIGPVRWHLQRVTAGQYEQRKQFAVQLKGLPRPLFIRDGVFALPWHATGGQHPAFVLDEIYYYPAQFKQLLRGGGIEQMVKDKKFPTLVLAENDGLYAIALAAGYQRAQGPFAVPTALTPSASTKLWILRSSHGE